MFPMENLHLEVIFMDFPMLLVVSGRYSHIFLSSDVLHCFAIFLLMFLPLVSKNHYLTIETSWYIYKTSYVHIPSGNLT